MGKNSTTARFSEYNVLEWDTRETNILKKYVKINVKEYNKQLGNETPEDLWVRCWGNVLRWGQKINSHLHSVTPNCYLSAHFNVQVHSTSTCYIKPVNQINDPDIICFSSLNSALNYCTKNYFKTYVIGGAQLYQEALNDERTAKGEGKYMIPKVGTPDHDKVRGYMTVQTNLLKESKGRKSKENR